MAGTKRSVPDSPGYGEEEAAREGGAKAARLALAAESQVQLVDAILRWGVIGWAGADNLY
jgi:hypothetical protein